MTPEGPRSRSTRETGAPPGTWEPEGSHRPLGSSPQSSAPIGDDGSPESAALSPEDTPYGGQDRELGRTEHPEADLPPLDRPVPPVRVGLLPGVPMAFVGMIGAMQEADRAEAIRRLRQFSGASPAIDRQVLSDEEVQRRFESTESGTPTGPGGSSDSPTGTRNPGVGPRPARTELDPKPSD